ncbi:MAG: O-acetyl-ADP-ribose deacetylase [Terriglobales bacterium]
MSEPFRLDLGGGKALEFVEGDITRQTTDAIVNAANSSLLGGGGVDGAIHRAGGPEILAECRAIRETQYRDRLPTGQAVATTAGRMPAKHVIHTVGPIWHGGTRGEPDLLASCYRESLRVADTLKLSSVAFPSISTGAYGHPVAEAAQVAVRAAAEALRAAQFVRTVRFVLFGERDYNVYRNAAMALAETQKGS